MKPSALSPDSFPPSFTCQAHRSTHADLVCSVDLRDIEWIWSEITRRDKTRSREPTLTLRDYHKIMVVPASLLLIYFLFLIFPCSDEEIWTSPWLRKFSISPWFLYTISLIARCQWRQLYISRLFLISLQCLAITQGPVSCSCISRKYCFIICC